MMVSTIRKILAFAGKEKANIWKSTALNFLYAIFNMLQVAAVYFIIIALVGNDRTGIPALTALVLMAVSVFGKAVSNRFSQLQQTHAGYFMVANKRIAIADKIKRIPMGYFNDRSQGELSGILSTVLGDLENSGPVMLVNFTSSIVNSIVFAIFIFIFDWRIGLLALAGYAVYLLLVGKMEKKSREIAPRRQKSEMALVSMVLERIQGMSVIKSFNLSGRDDSKVEKALNDNRDSNISLEMLFTPYITLEEISLRLFSVIIMTTGCFFALSGAMTLADALMTIVISFLCFAQIQTAGSAMQMLRIVSSSIDQAESVDSIPELDEKGQAIQPQTYSIEFRNVSFAYDRKPILKDVSIRIPEKTSLAIVGPSGSGKSTLCSLIARFWDVSSGSIRIGDHDIREYSLPSLMDQISMVFQRVYLFHDTIAANIRFGRPDASMDEIRRAAQKACCADFIEALPDGYDTVIGEGGADLSGGEKQRISIARAILKDAPIIIFDEATANVDPENEDKLQKAMESLSKDKTVIMIAHRLKTIRNADNIIVLDDGVITEEGNHEALMQENGLYKAFVADREEASVWKV